MKKLKSKIVTFALALCLMIPCVFMLAACGHTHSLTKVDAVAATCTTAGNTEYYKCDCGKYFSDAKAETEIEENSWIISATGHTYASTWTYNETHHWKEATCSHSTEKSEYAEHSLTNGACACGYAIVYTVADAKAWNEAFSGEHLNNGSLRETANYYENDVVNPDLKTVSIKKTIGTTMEFTDVDGEIMYLTKVDEVWYGIRFVEALNDWYGEVKDQTTVDSYSFASLASTLLDKYGEFEYDEVNKCYVKEDLYPDNDFKVFFENGKLVKIELKTTTSATTYTLTEYLCYDYGTTTIDLPEWKPAP